MIYDIVPATDPILRQKTEPFDFANPPCDPLDLVSNLAETMLSRNGMGIAANQCGLPYRVFVLKGVELMPCFNPRIIDVSEDELMLEEGCLTHPGLFVKIKRPQVIKVRYALPNGEIVTERYQDLTARVFQHELDHLDGICPLSRASRIHLEQARNKAKKLLRKSKTSSTMKSNGLYT